MYGASMKKEPCALRPPRALCPRGHLKTHQAHFRVHFREHRRSCREHSPGPGSLRGDHMECLTHKASAFAGISMNIFVYTPIGIFMSVFVKE